MTRFPLLELHLAQASLTVGTAVSLPFSLSLSLLLVQLVLLGRLYRARIDYGIDDSGSSQQTELCWQIRDCAVVAPALLLVAGVS